MTGTFTIDLDFHGVGSQLADDLTTLVGVRYVVDGKDIAPTNTETAYMKDYLPDLLRKWLHDVRSLDTGDERIFEFTEYSDVQFRLRPLGNHIELTVTKRHQDEIFGTYELALEQIAQELIDATARYREWLLDHNPELASAPAVQELQELSETISEETTSNDDSNA